MSYLPRVVMMSGFGSESLPHISPLKVMEKLLNCLPENVWEGWFEVPVLKLTYPLIGCRLIILNGGKV